MTKLFLETTIQIQKDFGTKEQRRNIKKALQGKQLLTSTYVMMEYLRTIVADAVYIYVKLKETEDIGEALIHLSELRQYEHRRASRCYVILGRLVDRCGIDQDVILTRLETFLEWQWYDLFSYGVEEIIDETGCMLTKRDVQSQEQIYRVNLRCRREEKQCQLVEFLNSKRDSLVAIREKLYHQENSQQVKISELIAEVLEDITKAQGRNNCWRLGDVIIALEVPDDAVLYTTNVRHFQPICAALGKNML